MSLLVLLTFWTLWILPATTGATHIARDSILRHKHASNNSALQVRGANSKWSWYDTETGNPGLCGEYIKNSDFVVARSASDFSNSDCFKTVTLSYKGRTAQAVIKDVCSGCPPNGLDLSKGLYRFIAPDADDILWDGDWWFGGEKPGPTSSKETQKQSGTSGSATSTTAKETGSTSTKSTTAKISSTATTTSVTTTTTTRSTSTSTESATTVSDIIPKPSSAADNLSVLFSVVVELGGLVNAVGA
ncbi:hypothetical protein DFP72DRAFT_1175660 [Ephemerocybe angulata]|uniref:RlpA-like protein double-psi beta-barrel domain-containing protein n=1 Tax=Ephemerocybe angulata TaxID=980116 RepID=A0A8H6HFW2_9AGAR|nr:hypothetical protein DFP72DRAFT_1175660 [Tulosesus angulatus]